MNGIINQLKQAFESSFGQAQLMTRSPGRINLIGEHTDYNEGFVFPAAIDKAVYMAIGKGNANVSRLIALDLNESFEFDVNADLAPVAQGWVNYFLGVIYEFKSRGLTITNFNLVFTSDVPLGAGLSSSAALESSFGLALATLHGHELSKVELAKIGQKAEHTFAGVKCGIMDQYASCLGKANQALMVDCRTLEHKNVPCDLGEYQFVLFDSCVKHNLASTEYNIRRQECEEGVKILDDAYGQVNFLRDVSLDQVIAQKEKMSDIVFKRCKFVVEENERVQQAVEALQTGDVQKLGQLIWASHQGLSTEYEVSCRELDVLVNLVKSIPAVIGARMMGGGFGGCTLNLVKRSEVENVIDQVSSAYKSQTGIELKHYEVNISDGAQII